LLADDPAEDNDADKGPQSFNRQIDRRSIGTGGNIGSVRLVGDSEIGHLSDNGRKTALPEKWIPVGNLGWYLSGNATPAIVDWATSYARGFPIK
jgi:hypothetical protein